MPGELKRDKAEKPKKKGKAEAKVLINKADVAEIEK